MDGAAAGGALTASSESGSAALPPTCLTAVLAQPVHTAGFKLPQLLRPKSHVLLVAGDSDTGPGGNRLQHRKNSLLAAKRAAWANKSAAPSVN